MTAQNQRTLKLIREMVESVTGCTPGILGLILKNYILITIRVTVSWSRPFDRACRVTLEMIF